MAHLLLPIAAMRTLIGIALSLSACLIAVAKPAPLTVKDVGLMLRSGYSVEAVQSELAKRHFIDAVDATAEKTLLLAGATPALVAALKGGAYTVPPEQMAAAQSDMEAQARRKALQAEEAR